MGRGLLHLPDELLLALLARLSPPSLCAARACDRRLRGLASDPALWRAALLQRWRRPEVCSPPTCGWMKEYSRRHKQDGRVPGLLRELHAAARCSSQTDRRDRLWRELLAAGLEIYDVASELVENGGADERDEAENLLRAINQGVVGREWHALIRKAEREETKADVSRPADATRMPVVWSGSQADGRPDCPEVGLQGSNTSHNSSSSSLPDLGLDALRRAFPCAEPPIRVEDGALLLVRWHERGRALAPYVPHITRTAHVATGPHRLCPSHRSSGSLNGRAHPVPQVRWYATGPGLREPEMVADRCREGLDMLAVRLSRRLPRPFEPKDAVRALSHLLFTEDGYKGNEVNYYSPSNSLLDHVLESRTGIPISLSVLFAAVCRRVGVHLDMIGMPGHFLLATQPTASEPRTFVDVFHGGKLLGLADCEAIVRSYGIRWSESMVTPVPMSEVHVHHAP